MSLKPGRLLVVADSDILTSRLWNANKQEEQEIYDFIPYSGNMDFIERAVDYVSGNTKILSISPKFTPFVSTPIGAVLLLETEETFAQKQFEIKEEQAKVLRATAFDSSYQKAGRLRTSPLGITQRRKVAKTKHN